MERDGFIAKMADGLPKLAWCIQYDFASHILRALHGPSVELGPDYLVEGVWDGPFADGMFHEAEHFFGSGVRMVGDQLWLVPSKALVDRIVYCTCPGSLLASNSLALLLGLTGARLDPSHDYRMESYTILKGIEHYERRFHIADPSGLEFRQVYHRPVLISHDGDVSEGKVAPRRQFLDYDGYLSNLQGALDRIAVNAQAPERMFAMKSYSTISTGYDSPAVNALIRKQPLEAAYTSRRSNSTFTPWLYREAAVDDGTGIARHLGLLVKYLDSDPAAIDRDELFFLAPSAAEPELIYYSLAKAVEKEAQSALVYTGFHGDKLWDANLGQNYRGDLIKRGDISGLALSEVRLKAGFVNIAVPFMFARSIADLYQIANSSEMSRWQLGTSYDRPIPRRILESMGVERRAFGQRKKAVVQRYSYPENLELQKEFLAYIHRRFGWTPSFIRLREIINKVAFLVVGTAEGIMRLIGSEPRETSQALLWKRVDLPYELHVWSLGMLAQELAGKLDRKVIEWLWKPNDSIN